MVFANARGWILATVFSIFGTTVGIQFGWIGPQQSFVTNLMITAVIWIGARIVAKVVSRY